MWAVETEADCFRYTCAVLVLVSKHFFDTDTKPMLAVSADTEYPMLVSVSPY